MNQIKREITTYEVGGGYFVDVETNLKHPEEYNVWIWHNMIGLKMMAFGGLWSHLTNIHELEEIIEANIENYIDLYKKIKNV